MSITTEKEDRIRKIVEVQPYNTDAWNELYQEATSRSINDPSTVQLWEFLLKAFPTSGKWWTAYADAQINAGNMEAAKDIFSRCLLHPYLPLWRSYLKFMQLSLESQNVSREEMRKAHEFSLQHIGLDIGSGPLWEGYIAFLKSYTLQSASEDSERVAAIRKAYQTCVVMPIFGVEQLWKEYERYENSVNKAQAKTVLGEYQPRHGSARAILSQRRKVLERIDHGILAIPPGQSLQIDQQLDAWTKLLSFEKQNLLRLPQKSLVQLVAFCFDQSLMSLRLHARIWLDFSSWHEQNDDLEGAVKVLQRAVAALPGNLFLHFLLAEMEERRGQLSEARSVLEKLLEKKSGKERSLVQIQIMRFARRNEGVDSARKVFMTASRAPDCTHHIFVASALMEVAVNKDIQVARNVFKHGLTKFIQETDYILEYANFLRSLNDDKNLRALFENTLNVLPKEKSAEVWRSYVDSMIYFGENLQSLLQLEKRRREALSSEEHASGSRAEEIFFHFTFKDLEPCSISELTESGQVNSQQEILPSTVAGRQGLEPAGAVAGTIPRSDSAQVPTSGYQPARAGLAADVSQNLPPAVAQFLASLHSVPGPYPDPELVISIFLQNEIPLPGDGLSRDQDKSRAVESAAKRKDDTGRLPPEQLNAPLDIYRMRLLKKMKSGSTSSQKGMSGSKLSGTQSGD